MPRVIVRWCYTTSPHPQTLIISLCILLLEFSFFWIATVSADCWYSDRLYDEGVEVKTAEPCLNCTCSRGALLCYLRVCTVFPDPPPPGCVLLHRYRTCCPELICTELFYGGGGNGLEGRSEPDDLLLDTPEDRALLENACIANGSIYGPGSAMDSSSLCEYCYCLGGKQTCVKPKCLLPLPGCIPMYEPTNCCPVHYNCTYEEISSSTTSTTTMNPKPLEQNTNGCTVDGVRYEEGGKVLGVGHSVCDNCYCLRGVLRCEPLSCAPPLLGCLPVIRPGECCAASYNCSGTIEIQPQPNYGQYPVVSKEYAKLRKEVQHNSETSKTATENPAVPFYVIAEGSKTTAKMQRSSTTFGTTRHFIGTSMEPITSKPLRYNALLKEKEKFVGSLSRNRDRNKFPATGHANKYRRVTTEGSKPTDQTTFRTPNTITTHDYKEHDKTKSSDFLDLNNEMLLLSIVDSLLDNRLNRGVESKNVSDSSTILPEILPTTTSISEPFTSTDSTVSLITDTTLVDYSSTDQLDTTTSIREDTIVTTTVDQNRITVKTVLNSTDCVDENGTVIENRQHFVSKIEVTTILPVDANEINKLKDIKDQISVSSSSEEPSGATTSIEDITEVDLESKVNVGGATLRNIPKIPLTIDTILKNKEADYDLDYNEPTLPPSLPNLRIIPFVAADALDTKEKHGPIYSPKERVTEPSFGFTNLFSPPIETEGGFIPKQPPILDHFYGNIVCPELPCPLPGPGCRKSSGQELTTCCPSYICDGGEAPTVVLDRFEGTSNLQPETITVADGVKNPDPFRDVIRTEPPPDLQSLIVDMMSRKTTPISPPSSLELVRQKTDTQTNNKSSALEITTSGNIVSGSTAAADEFSFDKVIEFLFFNQEEKPKTTTERTIQTTQIVQTSMESFDRPATPALSIVEKTKPYSTRPTVSHRITQSPVPQQPETRENSNSNHLNNRVDSAGVSPLKLAGCNIYGRMYRVNRVISELSNACLECKCTETGVQCRKLKC